MDQEIRNKLRNVVTQCRKLLEDSVSQELEGKYGIFANKYQVIADPNATMTHLTEEEQAARNDILDHFGHIKARGFKPKEALDQLVREIAFTHLNRLCAYKMMEAREVYIDGQKFREAVSRGIKSNGFLFYLGMDGHEADERLYSTGQQEVAYRHFLDWLGGLLSQEIGVLFNPNDPANRLFPRQKTLDAVLDLLNDGGIKPEETELKEEWPKIWSQDETIGWVYQYFTPKELRDQARKESAAPRDSYELAFRNQFFTPRYVVEFLTDNTLGRIWYEMRKGDTKLKDQCRYMVRRPTEIFLEEGEQPPKDAAQGQDDLSQEELLKLPVYIPHRPKKDPRELNILDPACGSGHFLLYCFDLLLAIYEEAYADSDLGPALQKDYPMLETLRRDVPRLILAYNLHGIDIDLRCSQIAALALWLRCQRAYQDMSLRKDRTKITRSNFVCAEPMPGEDQMLKEFVGQLEPTLLGQMVTVVFHKMKLAGEAGSLLKIEEEIRDAVAAAKDQWVRETTKAIDRKGQPLLFTQSEIDRLTKKEKQPSLFDLKDITDDQFFERAESEAIKALRQYAEKAQNGPRFQRRLFMEDAVQGFAFVDLCHQRYDVVLMNPPFGQGTAAVRDYLSQPETIGHEDLGMAFVTTMASRLADGGRVGAITSRTYAAIPTARAWRDEVLFGNTRLAVFADLGYGVLDTAMVEAASYVIAKGQRSEPVLFITALESRSKEEVIQRAIESMPHALAEGTAISHHLEAFTSVPGHVLCYWLAPEILVAAAHLPSLGDAFGEAKSGLNTGDDFRFLRLAWEVSPGSLGTNGSTWSLCCKGGEYQPFFDDVDIALKWAAVPEEMLTLSGARVFNTDLSFRLGVVYPMRTTSDISFRPLAPNCCFNKGAQFIAVRSKEDAAVLIALSYTRPFKMFVDALYGGGDVSVSGSAAKNYTGGVINGIPVPKITFQQRDALFTRYTKASQEIIGLKRFDEMSRFFLCPFDSDLRGDSLAVTAERRLTGYLKTKLQVGEWAKEIDDLVVAAYGFTDAAKNAIRKRWGEHPFKYKRGWEDLVEGEVERFRETVNQMSSSQWTSDGDIEGSRRLLTKKGFFSDRMIEVLAHTFSIHPSAAVAGLVQCNQLVEKETVLLARDTLSYAFGCIFGRWDVRKALSSREVESTAGPFDPLPLCPPGSLEEFNTSSSMQSRDAYPLRRNMDGILSDDEDNASDILRGIRECLEVVWTKHVEKVEEQACEILGVRKLRDYFRKPTKGGFWEDHLARYSKSRRKAPIYWLLQSSKKNYALWLYYHRLDKDLLFKALVNYVEPKIRLETSRLESLLGEKAVAGDSGKEAKRLAKELEQQEDFLSELRDFEDKLRRAANVQLVPDFNDGVVLNIAPLHELVPWKEAKSYWEALLKGEYGWSSIGQQLRQKRTVK
jgi:hypothetical protein